MSGDSLAVKIARKLCENATSYFCQSLDGSVVTNDFELFVKDIETILVTTTLEREKLVSDNINNEIIEYIRNRIQAIDNHYIRKGYRNKAKLKLLDEIANRV